MIGDAPGDYNAAKKNNALFFPINPGSEEKILGTALQRSARPFFQRHLRGRLRGAARGGVRRLSAGASALEVSVRRNPPPPIVPSIEAVRLWEYFARQDAVDEINSPSVFMKAFAGRSEILIGGIAASLAWGSTSFAQAPALPPRPPGATFPVQTGPGWVQRPSVQTNPIANPFVLPRPQASVQTPAVPAPLAPKPALTATPLPPFTPQPQPAFAMAMQPADPNVIKWDAELKEYTSKPGEMNAPFTFWLTNVSSSEVLINNVRTSCGCTVAKLPAYPWHIPPGGGGPIEVNVNLAGKAGIISKGVTVESSAGVKMLTVRTTITPATGGQVAGGMGDVERLKNMQIALADRQVLFKKQECATCHADPAKGKTAGGQVYAAVCSVCHDSQHRAAMVTDLRNLNHPTDAEHWRKWITYGRAGSMMPAFAQSEGGPLDGPQIDALVDYMVKAFPSRPAVVRPNQAAVAPPSTGTQPAALRRSAYFLCRR